MVVIPHSADPDSWQAAYEIVDAVVMMGGPDVSAEAYGATPHPLTKPGHAGFDTTELGLARACLRDGKPRARHLPRQPGAQRRSGRHARAGRALDGHVRSCTWASGCAWSTTRRAATTRSRCSPGTRSPTGSEPARTSSTPTTTRRSSGSATGCAPRPSRPTARSRPSSRPTARFAVGLQWHNEFHMRADARYARPLQALVDAARALRDGRPGRPPLERVDSTRLPAASARRRRPARRRR